MLGRLSLEQRILPVEPLPHPHGELWGLSSSEVLLEVTWLVRGVDRHVCTCGGRGPHPPFLWHARVLRFPCNRAALGPSVLSSSPASAPLLCEPLRTSVSTSEKWEEKALL